MDYKNISQNKPWEAKAEEVKKYWRELEPNLPIMIKPVSKYHRGSRYAEDGLRITGSASFIASVISRLKDILNQESGAIKVDVEYRQVADKSGLERRIPKFVFYVHLTEKEDAQSKKIKKGELGW